ncbi:MAG: PLP-dependent aminotransferase family protein [Desulfobacteraceae bacterium]|nr:PLP-dependent aminotransferase family protein [Desulfobacteraceae bacterium]
MTNFDHLFSSYAIRLNSPTFNRPVDLSNKLKIISFAGGLPDPSVFPVNEIAEISQLVLQTNKTKSLQYSQSEGALSLRENLQVFMKEDGVSINADQLMITTSSKQGLDILSRLFINPNDIVFTEKTTYTGAIQVFKSYAAEICGVPMDGDGIDTEQLERMIKKYVQQRRSIKFIYIIPDFQNPTGITLSLERRKRIIQIAERYNLILIEDSPYRQLRYEGVSQPSLIELDSDRVISINSFSKILAPGFRIGWIAGPKHLIKKAILAKRLIDICAPPLNQCILSEFLKRGSLQSHLKKLISGYKIKRDLMLECLAKDLRCIEGVNWARPHGGMYIWLVLPNFISCKHMLQEATQQGISYIPGNKFDPKETSFNAMRLCFSMQQTDQIVEGITILSKIIKSNIVRNVI